MRRHCEELATKQSIKPTENFLDCFANARNDGKRHSEGAARRISLNKRSFATAQDDNVTLLHCCGSLCKDDEIISVTT